MHIFLRTHVYRCLYPRISPTTSSDMLPRTQHAIPRPYVHRSWCPRTPLLLSRAQAPHPYIPTQIWNTHTHRYTQRLSIAHKDTSLHTFFSFSFFFNLAYSRWTSSLPSCLWSLRIFPSLPGSRLTIFYRDASSAILQLVNQWLNFTYSGSHAFRYGRKNTNLTW